MSRLCLLHVKKSASSLPVILMKRSMPLLPVKKKPTLASFYRHSHVARKHQSLVILADYTDVFIICLALSTSINSNMYLRRGAKSRVRMASHNWPQHWGVSYVHYYLGSMHGQNVTPSARKD